MCYNIDRNLGLTNTLQTLLRNTVIVILINNCKDFVAKIINTSQHITRLQQQQHQSSGMKPTCGSNKQITLPTVVMFTCCLESYLCLHYLITLTRLNIYRSHPLSLFITKTYIYMAKRTRCIFVS